MGINNVLFGKLQQLVFQIMLPTKVIREPPVTMLNYVNYFLAVFNMSASGIFYIHNTIIYSTFYLAVTCWFNETMQFGSVVDKPVLIIEYLFLLMVPYVTFFVYWVCTAGYAQLWVEILCNFTRALSFPNRKNPYTAVQIQ